MKNGKILGKTKKDGFYEELTKIFFFIVLYV